MRACVRILNIFTDIPYQNISQQESPIEMSKNISTRIYGIWEKWISVLRLFYGSKKNERLCGERVSKSTWFWREETVYVELPFQCLVIGFVSNAGDRTTSIKHFTISELQNSPISKFNAVRTDADLNLSNSTLFGQEKGKGEKSYLHMRSKLLNQNFEPGHWYVFLLWMNGSAQPDIFPKVMIKTWGIK